MTTTPAPTLNRDAVTAALRVIGDHRRVRNVRGCTGCDWTPRNPGYASDPAATARRHHQFNTHLAEAVTAAVTEVLTGVPSAAHRDLVSRLGFGDNITEPMADNDTIIAWYTERSSEAAEWREHERFRDECALAGHPTDQDCAVHGPTCCHRPHGDPRLRDRIEDLIGGPTPPVFLSDRPNKIHRVQHRDDRLGATITQSMILVDDIVKALEPTDG